MVRKTKTKRKGAMLGMLGGLALRYAVPAAVKYLQSRGKKSKKGSGTKMLGSSKCNCKHGKGVRQLGTRGRGVRRLGTRGKGWWDNVKKAAKFVYNQPEIQQLVKRGKDYGKRKINECIDDPEKCYSNVKSFFGRGHYKKGGSSGKSFGKMNAYTKALAMAKYQEMQDAKNKQEQNKKAMAERKKGFGTKTITVRGYKGKTPPKSASISGVHTMMGPSVLTVSRRAPPRNGAPAMPNSLVRKQARRAY